MTYQALKTSTDAVEPQNRSPIPAPVSEALRLDRRSRRSDPKSVHQFSAPIPFTFDVPHGVQGNGFADRPQRYSPLPDPKPVHHSILRAGGVLGTALVWSRRGWSDPKTLHQIGPGCRPPISFTNSPYPQPKRPTTVHRIPKSTCLAPHKRSPSSQGSSPYRLESLARRGFRNDKGLPKGLQCLLKHLNDGACSRIYPSNPTYRQRAPYSRSPMIEMRRPQLKTETGARAPVECQFAVSLSGSGNAPPTALRPAPGGPPPAAEAGPQGR